MAAPVSNPPKIGPLLAGIFGACVVGAVMGAGVSLMVPWVSRPEAAWGAAAGAAACVLIAAVLAGAGLSVAIKQQPKYAPVLVVGAGMARLLIALSLALMVFFLVAPEGKPFWVAFLLAGLLSIIVEAGWAVRMNSTTGTTGVGVS
ncbi:MAG: hypothetical protein ACREJO_17420 [Phycisphaerales bacterium]